MEVEHEKALVKQQQATPSVSKITHCLSNVGANTVQDGP